MAASSSIYYGWKWNKVNVFFIWLESTGQNSPLRGTSSYYLLNIFLRFLMISYHNGGVEILKISASTVGYHLLHKSPIFQRGTQIKSKFQRKIFFRSTPGQRDGVLGSTLTCKYLSFEAFLRKSEESRPPQNWPF